MKIINSLFDVRITRLLFHRDYWKSNWDNFINSLLSHETDWENAEHLIVAPTTLRLEVLGFSLKEINAELELTVNHHKEILASYKTPQDADCDLLDALLLFCKSFYENHPLLSVDVLKNRVDVQFNHFSKVHELGRDLYRFIIGDWMDAFSHPSSHKALCTELAWDAAGRFVDLCRFNPELEKRREVSEKRDLSMLRAWAALLTNEQINLSAYRFISRIYERDNTGWGEAFRPAKGLSSLNDAADPDVVHAFSFGNFSYLKEADSTLHYDVIVFIRVDEAPVFLQRAQLYKAVLDGLQKPMGLAISPKPGKAYLVDSKDCKVRGYISGIDMNIHYF